MYISILFYDSCVVVNNFGDTIPVNGYSNSSYSITIDTKSPGVLHNYAHIVVSNLSKPQTSRKVIPESSYTSSRGRTNQSGNSLNRSRDSESNGNRGFSTSSRINSSYLPDVYPDYNQRIAYLIRSSGRIWL